MPIKLFQVVMVVLVDFCTVWWLNVPTFWKNMKASSEALRWACEVSYNENLGL
jgi:hypothetical protein